MPWLTSKLHLMSETLKRGRKVTLEDADRRLLRQGVPVPPQGTLRKEVRRRDVTAVGQPQLPPLAREKEESGAFHLGGLSSGCCLNKRQHLGHPLLLSASQVVKFSDVNVNALPLRAKAAKTVWVASDRSQTPNLQGQKRIH